MSAGAAASKAEPGLDRVPSEKDAKEQKNLSYYLLVYNVSHSDLLVALPARGPDGQDEDEDHRAAMIGRPKFNKYKLVADAVHKRVVADEKLEVVKMPLRDNALAPCGFEFPVSQPIKFDDWEDFHIKSSQVDRKGSAPHITAAYIPLLALLLPRWLAICRERADTPAAGRRCVLYLVSGSGLPWNQELQLEGNSTLPLAELIKEFCRRFYPEIEVVLVHSTGSKPNQIFHYDDNVQFVNTVLKPKIEDRRRQLANMFFDKWPSRFHLTVALTGGAPARVAAINASLREFKPDCLHMWQLKTFWHEYPKVTDRAEADLEFHPFNKLEMTPAMPVADLDKKGEVYLLISEMKKFKNEFVQYRDSGAYSELGSFWLRKSKQPVLSVLMVKGKSRGYRYYRGINVEVSMPTGSLCSERNAIGSALARDPLLTRNNLRMIAVLSVPLDKMPEAEPATPTKQSQSPRVSPAMPPVSPPLFLRTNSSSGFGLGAGALNRQVSGNGAGAGSGSGKSMFGNGSGDGASSSAASSIVLAPPPERKLSGAPSAAPAVERKTSARGKDKEKDAAKPAAMDEEEDGAAASAKPAVAADGKRATRAKGGRNAQVKQEPAPKAGKRGGKQQQAAAAAATAASEPTVVASASSAAMDESEDEKSGKGRDALAAAQSPRSSPRSRVTGKAAAAAGAGAGAGSGSAPSVTFADSGAGAGAGERKGSKRKGSGDDSESSSPKRARLESKKGDKEDLTVYVPVPAMLGEKTSAGSVTTPHPATAQHNNPINPCGACNEWLKKIAEVNPDFKVITFTTPSLDACFIKPVKF